MNNSIKKISQGKVRNIFELNALILETTDRVSAFNSVFGGTVPNKGKVLQTISNKWMELLSDLIRNHIITCDPAVISALGFEPGRTVIAEKHVMLPVECIVRGYYIPTSHSWDSYKVDKTIQGITLPAGLQESEKLPAPIFTPTTKDADDLPLTFEEMEDVIDDFLWNGSLQKTMDQFSVATCANLSSNIAAKVKETSIALYNKAYEIADSRGVILADTKLEFGIELQPEKSDTADGFELVLCDEAFTPDSSRYWDKDLYEVGKTMPSMDKQYFRDYLRNEAHWTGLKDGPVPEVPAEVYEEISKIYGGILYKLFSIDI